jgi:oxygen-independent coproporphyrinogen-3 oxidase
MLTLTMIGHQDDFALSDVLRQFFGSVQRPAPDILSVAGPDFALVSESRPSGTGLGSISGYAISPAIYVATRLWLLPEDQAAGRTPFQILENYVPPADVRRELKRQLYEVLERVTDIHFPWGSLTGVRPTQIVERLALESPSLVEVRHDLIERWRLLPAKAELAIETFLAEQRVLQQIPTDAPLIYAGVPFCPSRCAYCSFIAQDAHRREAWLEPYVEALLTEAQRVFAGWTARSTAFYLGGGTPTSLPEPLLRRLLEGLKAVLPLAADAEITVEAGRPDTVTPAKLELLREFGATRICINPQTFHDKTLQAIGRQHTTEQTGLAMKMARRAGFEHINMDLIAGLPGESLEEFRQSLDQLEQWQPESVTIHTLAVKKSSRLSQESQAKDRDTLRINQPDPILMAMIDLSQQRLEQSGLIPYYLYRQKDAAGGLENVGFARAGHECLYNVGMMSDRRTVIGLGSGSITKRVVGRQVTRAPNDKDIAHYISRLDALVERKLQLLGSVINEVSVT